MDSSRFDLLINIQVVSDSSLPHEMVYSLINGIYTKQPDYHEEIKHYIINRNINSKNTRIIFHCVDGRKQHYLKPIDATIVMCDLGKPSPFGYLEKFIQNNNNNKLFVLCNSDSGSSSIFGQTIGMQNNTEVQNIIQTIIEEIAYTKECQERIRKYKIHQLFADMEFKEFP